MALRNIFLCSLFSFISVSAVLLFAGPAAQSNKPIPWTDVKRIVEKLKIENKVSRSDDGSEILLCTWKPHGWTLAMDISLSDDKRMLWLVVKLKKIEDTTKAPIAAAIALLEENDNIGPAYFSLETEGKQLLLNDPVVNAGITLENLDEELERIFEILKRSQRHWDPAMWPKTGG